LRNVLVVAPNWLGDAVMSLPLIGYLGGVRGLHLTVLSRPYTARIFWGLEYVDDLVVLPERGRIRGFLERSHTLGRIGLDGGVLLPPSFSSALALLAAGVRQRVGYSSDGRGLLLTVSLPGGRLREEHLSENYLRLGRKIVARLGLAEAQSFSSPVLQVFDHERDSVREVLRSCGAPVDDYAVVVPGATYGPTKSWPADRYRTLVKKLSRNVPVVLGGGQREREVCRSVGEGLSGVFNLAGSTSLGEFLAMLERARVLVANDSGASHVASSFGVPVVVIFGSTSPRWTRPIGEDVWIVREPVHCSPCFLRECPTRLECYGGISPQRVLGTVLDAIDRNVENTRSG
jgi:heptosyltransferase-2